MIKQLDVELDKLLVEQQTAKLTADEFSSKAETLDAHLQEAHKKLAEKREKLTAIKAKKASITRAVRQMDEHLVTEFCQTYWMAFVEQAIIFPDRIKFKMHLGGTFSQSL